MGRNPTFGAGPELVFSIWCQYMIAARAMAESAATKVPTTFKEVEFFMHNQTNQTPTDIIYMHNGP